MCKNVGNSLYFDQIRHHMYEISCKKLKVYQSVEDFLLYTCNCCARSLQQRHACVGNFLHNSINFSCFAAFVDDCSCKFSIYSKKM